MPTFNGPIYGHTIDQYTIDDVIKSNIAEVNKFNIPVGALVFVRTKNPWHSGLTWTTTTTPYININPPITTTTPITTPMTTGNPTWIAPQTTTGGGTYTPHYIDSGTGRSFEIDIDENLENTYYDMLKNYNTSNGTGGGSGLGGNGLGMATMSNKKKKKKKFGAAKQAKLSKAAKKPGMSLQSVYANSNTITINNNVYTTTSIETEYQVKGHKSVEECLQGLNPIVVKQENSYSEEELEEIRMETGMIPEIGKPFTGIVVDKFSPQLFTAKGEPVKAAHLPVLYKVLINENNCLWFSELDVAPMKTEGCPLKEEYQEDKEEK